MRLGAAPTPAFPVQLLLWAHTPGAPVGPAPHDSVFLTCPSENRGPVPWFREAARLPGPWRVCALFPSVSSLMGPVEAPGPSLHPRVLLAVQGAGV